MVLEGIANLPGARSAPSGGEGLRERYIREGIIKEQSAKKQPEDWQSIHLATRLVKFLKQTNSSEALKDIVRANRIIGSVAAHSLVIQAIKRLLTEEPVATEGGAPSLWAALAEALNIKKLAWATVTSVLGGAVCWQGHPNGKTVGFFSSSKVDARNTP